MYLDDLIWRGGLGLVAVWCAFGWWGARQDEARMYEVAMAAAGNVAECRAIVGTRLENAERDVAVYRAWVQQTTGVAEIQP